MVLLVPASIVALATIIRVTVRLWGRSVQQLANQTRAVVIAQKQESAQALTLTDARVIAMDVAMTSYLSLQPLSAIYALAPMVGALGTAWSLAGIWAGPSGLQQKNLPAAMETAFVPLGWGLVVGLLAISGYTILRARLARVEREVLAPAAIAALRENSDNTRPGSSAKSFPPKGSRPRER